MKRKFPALKQIKRCMDFCFKQKIYISKITIKKDNPNYIFINWDEENHCGLIFEVGKDLIEKVYSDK